MRRLIRSRDGQDTEQGAVTVLVALFMVVFLMFVALVIDVGMVYAEQAQLQNGADAAALAAAQQCAKAGATTCSASTVQSLAAGLANSNSNDGASAVTLDMSVAGQVTANTSTVDGVSHANFLSLPLGSITGQNTAHVTATATAAWGGPFSGPTMLPLTFGACQVTQNMLNQADQIIVVHGSDKCSSSNPSGLNLPGGFGWLATTSGCTPNVSVNSPWVDSKTGASIPKACKTLFQSASLIGQTVLVPIFSTVAGQGSGGSYQIVGWGVLVIKGWSFPSVSEGTWPGGGGTFGIYGHFTNIISYAAGFTFGGTTQYGASLPPQLTK